MEKIIPIIVSGGQGTRLWPLSRANMPKQFIPFEGEKSLFRLTLERVSDRAVFGAPVILCAKEHRFHIVDILKECGIADAIIVCELTGRNTAPAFCAGALAATDLAEATPQTQLLMLPADHYIPDIVEFTQAVRTAATQVSQGFIATYGIRPTKPHTGFGYIEKGEPTGAGFAIQSFEEKPDPVTAREYLQSGRYLWNAGIFQVRLDTLLASLETHCPEILTTVRIAWKKAVRDLGDYILDKDAFEAAPNIGFDHAVMEKTRKAWVMPANYLWDDLGSWDAFWAVSPKDEQGNVLEGDVVALQSENTYLRSTNQMLCAVGVKDIIAVATEDSILIIPKGRSEDVKLLIEALKFQKRPELNQGGKVYRPWGHYEVLLAETGFKVLRITLLAGRRFSLHKHNHRTEHWMVVRGQGHVIKDGADFTLGVNQSIYIPAGSKHRMENRTDDTLEIIEVQSGEYLGEDDMIRLEDDYNRTTDYPSLKTGNEK